MIALKGIIISKKTMADKMNRTKEEIQDMVLKINTIYTRSPESYAYLEGWVHGLLYSENGEGDFYMVAREHFQGFSDKNQG